MKKKTWAHEHKCTYIQFVLYKYIFVLLALQVSFYNVEAKVHVYTFNDIFGEGVYPFFSPCANKYGKNEAPLTITPVESSEWPHTRPTGCRLSLLCYQDIIMTTEFWDGDQTKTFEFGDQDHAMALYLQEKQMRKKWPVFLVY